MTIDADIYRAAKLMIDRHGDEAARYAQRRTNELARTGDSGAAAIWRQVMIAIAELQRGRREGGAVN